jgi:hypothetical protein
VLVYAVKINEQTKKENIVCKSTNRRGDRVEYARRLTRNVSFFLENGVKKLEHCASEAWTRMDIISLRARSTDSKWFERLFTV